MMAVNKRRGEIGATLNDKDWRLCLTLGALAELEDAFSAEDVGALVERFSSGQLSARDLICIIAAGLRGAGHDITNEEVAQMHSLDGATGFANIAAQLLQETFAPIRDEGASKGDNGASSPNPTQPRKAQ